MVQGLCHTLTAPIPIAIVREAEGTQVLPPIIPLPIPGEAAVQVPSAANAEVGLPRYLLSPNRPVPVLVVHQLIEIIP